MKSFKQHLKEDSSVWGYGSVVNFIFGSDLYVPLTPAVLNSLYGKSPPRDIAYHVLGIANLEKFTKLEGTKKGVSCFQHIGKNSVDSIFTGGVASGGGVVAELEGNVLLHSITDAYTKIDSSGRRWFSVNLVYANLSAKFSIADGKRLKIDYDRYQKLEKLIMKLRFKFLKDQGFLQRVYNEEKRYESLPNEKLDELFATKQIRVKGNVTAGDHPIKAKIGPENFKKIKDVGQVIKGRGNRHIYAATHLINHFYHTLTPQERNKLVKDYIDWCAKLVKKYPEFSRIVTNFMKAKPEEADNLISKIGNFDELVLTQFKIRHIAILPHHYVDPPFGEPYFAMSKSDTYDGDIEWNNEEKQKFSELYLQSPSIKKHNIKLYDDIDEFLREVDIIV